jgi:uracil-DNA glycosylase family 4
MGSKIWTTKLSNMDSLDQVATEVFQCTDCKLCQTRKNAVPGEGSPVTELMFIGEAPGRFEDHHGKPFVGSAGKILESALMKVNIPRSRIFITNVVKCRPPGNRKPKHKEIEACRQYLNRQISLINPKIICILGSTAYSSLLGGKATITNRGKILNFGGRQYFFTIHPAATIYKRSLRRALEDDLLELSRLILREGKAVSKANSEDE